MPLKSLAALLAGAALFLASPAAAMEPEAAADALAAALAKGSDSKAAYESAEADGANILIKGLTLSRGEEEPTITFAETRIEAPVEGGNGVFESPRVTFADGKVSGTATGTLGAATLTGVTVLDPATIKGDGLGDSVLFQTAEATDLTASRGDQPGEVTVARIFAESGNVVDNIAQDSRGVVEGAVLSPDFFSASAVKPETLGYDNIAFDMRWDGSRDVEAGTMTLRDLSVTMQDGGEISVAAMVGNLPDPRILNDPDATAAASKTKIHNLSIRYEDNSLAGRVLDYLAGQQGISREEYAQQMSAALPFLLAMINNPALQGEIATAIGAFLNDPKSLAISIAPAQPLSGEEIIDLVGSNPQTLPDRLNASITANQPE
jgi:hypothetical protein